VFKDKEELENGSLTPWGVGMDSHIKRTGVLVGNFDMTSKRYQDPVLQVWL